MWRPAPLSRSAALLLLLALAARSAEAGPQLAHVAVYDLSLGMVKLGRMERRLEVGEDGTYRYESMMETRGLAALLRRERVLESSAGELRDGRFMPTHYVYDNSRKKRHAELAFDHAAGSVARTDGASDWRATFSGPLFDKLVYQAQFMLDLATSEGDLRYAIADIDELKRYDVRRLGSEPVETGLGRFDTLRLERQQPGSTRLTTVWCARDLGWLPVRVDYRDKDGTVTTAVLRSLVGAMAPR